MTITPAELHQLKTKLAEALASIPMHTSYAQVALDTLDAALPEIAERRWLIYDADTGEELQPTNPAAHPARLIIGAAQFPGWPAEEIDVAYSAYMSDDDPAMFVVGRKVEHRENAGTYGTVITRTETDGELHTVGVRWRPELGVLPYSPRELREVRGR